ncbi:MAG: hypothetical protein JXP34_00325, partial [Planctomycetes bacterium]|nr:hypothetical protein [Planctomycetota bacterium]
PLGNRVTPPFAGRAGGVDGGPILTVRGRPFDLFVTLTAVRPGTVLVTGDLVRLAGLFWPLVPARLTAEIRGPLSPDADPVWDPLRLETRGNSVGAFATEAVAATRPGRYEVTLRGIHDGSISSGPVRPPYPEGDLLGTPDGRFSFYVVEDEREEATGRSACALDVKAIEEAPGRVRVQGSVPRAWDAAEVRLTATFPGVVLEERRLEIAAGRFEWVYDLEASRRSFPNLDPDPVDTICITLFASGRVEREIRYRASRIILQGRRIHVSP